MEHENTYKSVGYTLETQNTGIITVNFDHDCVYIKVNDNGKYYGSLCISKHDFEALASIVDSLSHRYEDLINRYENKGEI